MNVLDTLLEGFDPGETRGWHGRWIRGHGGKPGRLEGTYNGVKLERGVAYQGRLATGEIHTGTWTGKLTGRGVDDPQAHPEFRHVDTGAVRTFQGGEFFGKLSSVRPAAVHPSEREHVARAIAQLPVGGKYHLYGGETAIGHVTRTASGFEVHHGGTVAKHQLAGGAASYAMKVQRQARAQTTARQRGRASRLQASEVRPEALGALLEGLE